MKDGCWYYWWWFVMLIRGLNPCAHVLMVLVVCRTCPWVKPMHACVMCRILVFAPTWISTVKVQVDGVYLGEAQHSSGPLYVLQWEPFHYLGGLHTIIVQAVVSILRCTTWVDIPGWSTFHHGPGCGQYLTLHYLGGLHTTMVQAVVSILRCTTWVVYIPPWFRRWSVSYVALPGWSTYHHGSGCGQYLTLHYLGGLHSTMVQAVVSILRCTTWVVYIPPWFRLWSVSYVALPGWSTYHHGPGCGQYLTLHYLGGLHSTMVQAVVSILSCRMRKPWY